MINPGLACLIAAGLRLWGSDALWAGNLVILLSSLTVLGLTYGLFLTCTDRPTAVLMTCLLAVCRNLYYHSFLILTDVPFLVGAMLFLLGFARLEAGRRRVWLSWLLLILGGAVMTLFRLVAFTFFGAVGILLLWRLAHSPQRLRWLAVGGALTVVLLLALVLDPRRSPGHRLMPKERQAVELICQLGPAMRGAVADRLPHVAAKETTIAMFGINVGPVAGIPFALAAVACLPLLFRRQPLWGLLVLVFLFQWLVFFFDGRYFLAVMPLWVYAWWLGTRWVYMHIGGRRGTALFVALLSFYVTSNLLRDGKVIWQQRHADPLTVYDRGRYLGLPQLGQWLHEHTAAGATILIEDTKLDEALSFFSRRTALAVEDLAARPKSQAGLTITHVITPAGAAMTSILRARGLAIGQMVGQVPRDSRPPWVVSVVKPLASPAK
jgi:hypothetical protein